MIFRPLFLVCCLCVLSVPALAHPHAWIDYRTHVVLSDDNKITAIKEHWVFDEYYTEFALHDFDQNKSGKLDHDTLMALAHENLNNLKDFAYFTAVEEDGRKKAMASLGDIDSYLVNGHIALDFTVRLKEPADPVHKKVDYRIYDPTYYVSMLHDKKDAITLDGVKASACTHELTMPKPDVAMIDAAAALDKKAVAPDELGSFFAQKVTITCK